MSKAYVGNDKIWSIISRKEFLQAQKTQSSIIGLVFLQGGASIESRVQMPEKLVEEIYATHLPQAKSIFNPDPFSA